MNTNLIISGVGGQGNILMEKILGLAAVRAGFNVRASDIFGSSQRGGSVMTHFKLGDEAHSCQVSTGSCDIVLALEPMEALRVAMPFLKKSGYVLVNTAAVLPPKVRSGKTEYPSLDLIINQLSHLTSNIIECPASEMAEDKLNMPRSMNMIMTGVLIGLKLMPLSANGIKAIIGEVTGKFAKINIDAFNMGYEFVLSNKCEILRNGIE